jgi:hypothetical protein
MFTKSLPSNERLFELHYSGFRASCYNIILQTLSLKSLDRGEVIGFVEMCGTDVTFLPFAASALINVILDTQFEGSTSLKLLDHSSRLHIQNMW